MEPTIESDLAVPPTLESVTRWAESPRRLAVRVLGTRGANFVRNRRDAVRRTRGRLLSLVDGAIVMAIRIAPRSSSVLLRAAARVASPYGTVALLEAQTGPPGRDRMPHLEAIRDARPSDVVSRVLLVDGFRQQQRDADANVELAAAWLLWPATQRPRWLVATGTEGSLDAVNPPDLVADLIDSVSRDILALSDAAAGNALVSAALRRDLCDWLATRLAGVDIDQIEPVLMVRLADRLHQLGEIERPLELLRHWSGSSKRIEAARRQRERELAILRQGVELTPPVMRRSHERGATALYLLHNSLPHQSGGYATRTHGLLTNLNRAGHEVVGVTRPGFPAAHGTFDQRPGVAARDVIDGVTYERLLGPVTHLPRTDLQGFVDLYARMLQPLVDTHRPSVLHAASNWWNGHAATTAAKSLGLPSVYEVRGLWEVTRASRDPNWAETEVYRLDCRYEADAARSADRVIAITSGLGDELVRRGVDREAITIVPNAVDIDRFTDAPRDDALARELDVEGCCVIGFVGSFTFYEGLDDLLDAVSIVRSLTTTPIAVLFVGDGPIGPALKAQATELGLDKICRFTGRVPHDQVGRYLSVIDITPFPRKPLPVCEMVSPLKPLESMAAGIPVIVSAVQALAEMVPSDECGIVVPRSDTEALAAALASLVDDADRRRRIAENARDWVSAERSWNVISRRVGALYAELAPR